MIQKFLLISFSLIFITSCAGAVVDDPLTDHSFLTDQPCAAPCWYGLETDKSTEADVYATIHNLSFVDIASIGKRKANWQGDMTATEYNWKCTHPVSQSGCGTAFFTDGKLKELVLSVNYTLTFESVVKKLGPPDRVLSGRGDPFGDASFVYLQWIARGISVGTFAHGHNLWVTVGAGNRMPGNLQVSSISYVSLESFKSQDTSCCSRVPWTGFEP